VDVGGLFLGGDLRARFPTLLARSRHGPEVLEMQAIGCLAIVGGMLLLTVSPIAGAILIAVGCLIAAWAEKEGKS
jgi:hypothetical protein